MPNKPKRICSRCGKAVSGPCPCTVKQETRDAATISFNNRTYGRRWKAFRLGYLMRNPLCQDCQAEGRLSPATEVHHKTKLKEKPELQYEDDNLMPLCESHHSARTRKGE